jgi:cytoskeletal protein RodZ
MTKMLSLPDLVAIRESKGISLTEISRATKISRPYLEAIERFDFEKLPGGVFTTSYLRQYARAIDIDEWDLVSLYRDAAPGSAPEQTEPARGGRMAPVLRLLGLA